MTILHIFAILGGICAIVSSCELAKDPSNLSLWVASVTSTLLSITSIIGLICL